MILHLPWRFEHRAPSASSEALADAAKARRQRREVDSRWPDLLERSGLAQERLMRNHIGEGLEHTFGVRGD